ncbi:hypothetical protein MaudCBS49596_004085 [Microsporum audouinii]
MAADSSSPGEADACSYQSPQLPQTQSALFSRLLPEIREKIYYLVFQGLPRIKPKDKPLYWMSNWGAFPPDRPVDQSTTLLQTCQQISVELYFEKDQWTKTVEFIRDQMPELRHLHVNFYRRKNSMRARYCKHLFEERVYPSLMKMREMPCFQLMLNFNSVVPDKAPFKVIYVAKEGYETGDEVVNEDEDDGEYEWLDEVKDPEDIDEWTVSFH